MASLGSVSSTALTGGKAPVFESTAIKALTTTTVSESTGEVAELKAMVAKLTQMVVANSAVSLETVAPVEVSVEVPVEAPKTRAKKAE